MHYDNLAALVKADPTLGPLRSYSTVRRYMQAHGLVRKPRPAAQGPPRRSTARPSGARRREIRSYEAEYVGSLWHLDFHHGSLKVLTARGQWQRPLALGILDDHSRLCCHLQWYLSETAEDLVHGLSQAIQKRGLPRALLTDNGSAMMADEVTEGLLRLGIVHEKTLPYSPYQNGKQECFWATLEGRLMEMLGGVTELTLDVPQRSDPGVGRDRVQPRACTARSPVRRSSASPRRPTCCARVPPATRCATRFAWKTTRRQRQSDGTISLEGVRFEIPARYRHFRDVSVRYARWDLGRVDLVDPRSGTILAPLYPLDRTANADGQRLLFALDRAGVPADDGRRVPPPGDQAQPAELPPLLKRILAEYSATGLPPAYLPKNRLPRPRRSAHERQETAVAVGTEMEPVFAGAAQRGTAGDRQDRELRLAGRATGPGGRLRADLRRVGDRQVGGAADRRRTPGDAARRGGRRARTAPVQDRRLLSRAGRHLRGEAQPVQSLGWLQGPPRTLAGPRDLRRASSRCCWSTKPRR